MLLGNPENDTVEGLSYKTARELTEFVLSSFK